MSSYRFSQRRLLMVSVVTILLFAFLAPPLFAASFRGGDAVVVGKDELIDDDLFISGNTVVIDGVINGDLIVAGSQVTINGDVKGSVLGAGQMLVINGNVDGTVYSAGAAVTLGEKAQIGRNFLFAGYSMIAGNGSLVERDVIVAGYQAVLSGEVTRDLYASLGALELNGPIGGNVEATVGEPSAAIPPQVFTVGGPQLPPAIATGLRVGPEARIGGKLHYTSPVDQSSGIAARPEGGITFSAPPVVTTTADTTVPEPPPNPFIEWTLTILRRFMTLLILGALGLWMMPKVFSEVTEHSRSEPVVAGAWGLLALIVGYVGALLLTFLIIMVVAAFAWATLSGLATTVFAFGFSGLTFAFTLFSILVVYASKIVVVQPLTQVLLARMQPSWGENRWLPLIVGLLVYVLLRSIPWFGALLDLIVTIIGLGSIWLAFRHHYIKPTPAAPPLVLKPA